MSINKLISIKNPIVDAMDSLNVDHDKFIPKFTRWAVQAENEIGSWFQYVTKRQVLTINNCVACLPDDAVYVEVAVLGDLGTDCGDLMANACNAINLPTSTGTSANTFLVVDIGDNEGLIRGFVNFTIQNNKMIFEQNLDAQSVTIQYLTPEKDCDGFVMISQNHVLAIKWYIIWMYYYSNNTGNSLEYGKMNKAEQEWHRECSHARAQDSTLTPSDRKKIVGLYHNPYAGIGLNTGMYTTLGNGWNIW